MEYKKGFLLMDEPHWITPQILKGIKGDYAVGYNPVDDCDTIEIYEGDETIAFINLNPETDVICIRKDHERRLLNQPYLQRLMTKIYKHFQTHFYCDVYFRSDFDQSKSYRLILNVNIPTYEFEISMVTYDNSNLHRVSIWEFDSLEQFESESQGILTRITDYSYTATARHKRLIWAMTERREMNHIKSLLEPLNAWPIDHSIHGLWAEYNLSYFTFKEFSTNDRSFYPDSVCVEVTNTRSDFKKMITDSISEVPEGIIAVFIESNRLSGSYYAAMDLTK